jgi:tRNA(adenine34) deaminase
LALTTIDHETWMRWALQQADQAAHRGDVPVGCVIVDGRGTLVACGRNRREQDQDPTAHAEMVALRLAAAARGHWRLSDCTLYVTLEPCPMCAGAIVNARVARLVYGCHDPKAGAVRTLMRITDDDRLNHRAEVIEGVLADDCAQRLKDFFARLRRAGKK